MNLGDREIHVWLARLDVDDSRVAELRALLDADEQARADRFLFDIHRRRYTVGRGLLRETLARYTERSPRDLRFAYAPKGKPSLEGRLGISFNVSHTADLALYAFARGGQIGVDIEQVRADAAHEQIAENYFSPSERAALHGTPSADKALAFFSCWTLKEAFIKARGDGLSLALDSFDIDFANARSRSALTKTTWAPNECASWDVRLIPVPDGYVGAIATDKLDCNVFRYP